MINAQGTAIIRNRGQLTIPDSIRKKVNWTTPSSAVDISIGQSDEIIIRPHKHHIEVDWDKLFRDIKKLHEYPVKGTMSEFIAWDREHGHSI